MFLGVQVLGDISATPLYPHKVVYFIQARLIHTFNDIYMNIQENQYFYNILNHYFKELGFYQDIIIEVNNIHIKCCLLEELHPFGVRRFCPPPVILKTNFRNLHKEMQAPFRNIWFIQHSYQKLSLIHERSSFNCEFLYPLLYNVIVIPNLQSLNVLFRKEGDVKF